MQQSEELIACQRMLTRERSARAAAEKLLEEKSLELYEANQALQLSSEIHQREAFYLQTILDVARDGVITLTNDGVIEKANSNAAAIFNCSDETLRGRPVDELVESLAAGKPTRENRFFADLCSQTRPTIQALGISSDGERAEIELSASWGQLENGDIFIWVLRDVGAIQKIKRQSDLSQRLEGIGQLAAGIAHEVNTPIQFVLENSKFIADAWLAAEKTLKVYEQQTEPTPEISAALGDACSPEELRFFRSEASAAIEETIQGAERIATIVAAVKEFSHPGTVEKTVVDINRAVETAATVTANHWRAVASLDLALDPGLPRTLCVAASISQVFVNLIVNAADAIQEQNQKLKRSKGKIVLSTRFDEANVYIGVSDTGAGISPENLSRIFNPFFTTKDVGKGTGQGLSITHSIIVEKHGGGVDVESLLGEGTTFTIRLPR